MSLADRHAEPKPTERRHPLGWFDQFARRFPFLALFLVMIISNLFGSIFSFAYNRYLIVERHMSAEQRRVFWEVAAPWYNVFAYPLGVAAMVWLLYPLMQRRKHLIRGQPVDPGGLARCRRRVVALPVWQMGVNAVVWLPGAVHFPWIVTAVGGPHRAGDIWLHFAISFFVSTLLTTAQTFFLLEWFLTRYFYEDFFRDARPAEVEGVLRISLHWRLFLFWGAVAVVPLLALLAVAWNIPETAHQQESWFYLFGGVALVGLASGSLIFYLVGRDLRVWVHWHGMGARAIAQENFDFRIPEKRPDQWGRLTDAFNDMAAALGQARHERDMFGQFIDPDVRDEIIASDPGLGGAVQEITVLFADLRGFTRRSAGEAPERIVALLNRFFTLAEEAIRAHGGHLNKFLGDGFMALFGITRRRADDHADQAVRAARALLDRLGALNRELAAAGQAPLEVGIGIHTGPALVGCVGATLPPSDGRPQFRREYTAIGETVNLCQRIEQLTKQCGGPILISEASKRRMRQPWPLTPRGEHLVPGGAEAITVYQVGT